MDALLSFYWLLAASLWLFINGILHDIFVIKNHKDGYNRDLLRLLMDGHVLMLSGVLMFVCYLMARHNIQYGPIIGMIVAIGMIIYCALIFPFLKSFITLFISIITLIVCLKLWLAF